MARLGKRERIALKEIKRLNTKVQVRASLIEGRSLTRGNFDNLMPSGKSRPKWGWDWKADRRISAKGSW